MQNIRRSCRMPTPALRSPQRKFVESPSLIFRRNSNLVRYSCRTTVPEEASVCTRCDAEVVRGATRRERRCAACAVWAIFVFIADWDKLGYSTSTDNGPCPDGRGNVVGNVVGQLAMRWFRRSSLCFFRTNPPVKGAFTGALRDKTGRFELADWARFSSLRSARFCSDADEAAARFAGARVFPRLAFSTKSKGK